MKLIILTLLGLILFESSLPGFLFSYKFKILLFSAGQLFLGFYNSLLTSTDPQICLYILLEGPLYARVLAYNAHYILVKITIIQPNKCFLGPNWAYFRWFGAYSPIFGAYFVVFNGFLYFLAGFLFKCLDFFSVLVFSFSGGSISNLQLSLSSSAYISAIYLDL